MSARVLEAATQALAVLFSTLHEAPVENVNARAGARRWRSAQDELAASWHKVADELARTARLHDDVGARIEAWAELPPGSAASVAEARALAEEVALEIGRLQAVQHRLEQTARAAADVVAAQPHLRALGDELGRWVKDAGQDKANLLLAARAVLVREPQAPGQRSGIVQIPLEVQVERALAEAYDRKETRTDELRAIEGLRDAASRGPAAAKLLRDLDSELLQQRALHARVAEALLAARDEGALPGPELRAADDRVRAWGMDLAHTRGRLAKIAA